MQESNKSQPINEPGIYADPESGVTLEALNMVQADALVHLGWKKQTEAQKRADKADEAEVVAKKK